MTEPTADVPKSGENTKDLLEKTIGEVPRSVISDNLFNSNKIAPNVIEKQPEPDITDVPKLVIPENLFNSNKISLNLIEKQPEPDPKLGYTDELNNTKNKITPYAETWEKTIKFYLSDFELIDIYRNPKFAYQRYNEPIIKYREKWDKDEWKGLYPIFSRAYFKLWEVLGLSNVLDRFKGKPLTVGNVAEGPGGFIHCLIDFRKKQNGSHWHQDSYHAISLKIEKGSEGALDWDFPKAKDYFEYVRRKRHKVTLSYGADGTGNMLILENLEHFMKVDLQNKKCELVTGDGGIDLRGDDEFSKQEITNAPLFYSEILYALHIQAKDGSFILKIYDIYYTITVQLLLLLRLFYQEVRIIKPYTSRPASSEKYLICEGFRGITTEQMALLAQLLKEWVKKSNALDGLAKQNHVFSVLDFDLVPSHMDNFVQELAKFNKKLSDYQINKIHKGLELVKKGKLSEHEILEVKKRQKELAISWCKYHKVPYHEQLELTIGNFGDRARRSRSRSRENDRNNIKLTTRDLVDEEKKRERAKKFGSIADEEAKKQEEKMKERIRRFSTQEKEYSGLSRPKEDNNDKSAKSKN